MNFTYFKDLTVWQKSIQLVKEAYILINTLPKEENFALAGQMRRAAVSIPSNIAEGQQRLSTKEYIHFLSIARGSCAELETQFYLCEQLDYLKEEQTKIIFDLLQEVGRMINGLIVTLKNHSNHN